MSKLWFPILLVFCAFVLIKTGLLIWFAIVAVVVAVLFYGYRFVAEALDNMGGEALIVPGLLGVLAFFVWLVYQIMMAHWAGRL